MHKQYYRFAIFAILVTAISSVLAADAGSDFIAASGDSVPQWNYGMIEQGVIISSAFLAGFTGYLLNGFGWALFAFVVFTAAQGYGINNPKMVTSVRWHDLTMAVVALLSFSLFVIEMLIKSMQAIKNWWKKESRPDTPSASIGGGM